MGREIILSLVLHVAVFATTMLAGSFNIIKPTDFGDVIRVGVVSLPEITPTVEPVPTIETPRAVQAEPEEIVLDDPTTRPAAEIEEPIAPEPKPSPAIEPVDTGDQDQTGDINGDTEVQTQAVSGISGATVDNASFEQNYPFWFSLAFNKISQNFRVPFTYDGTVTCQIYFQVIKSGKVIELRVDKPSGIPEFDRACKSAIRESERFPQLPDGFLPEIIGITLGFTNQR